MQQPAAPKCSLTLKIEAPSLPKELPVPEVEQPMPTFSDRNVEIPTNIHHFNQE